MVLRELAILGAKGIYFRLSGATILDANTWTAAELRKEH